MNISEGDFQPKQRGYSFGNILSYRSLKAKICVKADKCCTISAKNRDSHFKDRKYNFSTDEESISTLESLLKKGNEMVSLTLKC
jgi:hypothetical protein